MVINTPVIPADAGIQNHQNILFTNGQSDKFISVMGSSFVYILANNRNGTLYVGVTSDLVKRIWEHKNDVVEGFTKRYGVHSLVWYEEHDSIENAIQREKNIKRWYRDWKLELIEQFNPTWRDLYEDVV